uniref:NADH-ubiquinone oxidoreductase chain 4 n=1 Tax=Oxyomus sylvestris TaxID=207233 RepID=A0A343C3H4_OXYSY|nr:NADH dehydrogenase subunit 4 [Oxyomus sylvestris]
MMKFLLMVVFMMPLSFLKKSFWLNQYMYLIMTFIFLLLFNFNFMFSDISYFLGCDLLSFVMILLTLWVCSLMIMASEGLYKKNYFYKLFLMMMIILLFSLLMTFMCMNLLVFYLFFEMSLIPTLILIIGWGYQPERLQAGIYLLFYTMVASLPMLISIFYYYYKFNSLIFFYFLDSVDYMYMYMCMNMVFFVKMPMYFVHLWLPKAHVEAPVSGSMILAGIMLKLGGYGLMRLMKIFLTLGTQINFIFVSISMIGGMFVSLICLRQTDIKALIAYSSVAHMGLVLSGIMTLSYWGMCGALVMMLAHGLCSSGLFCLANISYERVLSRSMFMNKGLINLMPSMSLWWFLLSSSNMAAPPSLNLLGEIMLINSLVSWSWLCILMLVFMSFLSAVYSLYLYSYTQHGKLYSSMYSMFSGCIREYLLLFLHWVPLNLLILKSEFFVLWI